MTVSNFTWFNAAVIAFAIQQVVAQTCYYPNGSVAPSTEKPCSTADGSACCPDNWICLDNGLCHYPVHNLYERYSCTDKSWDSPGCPSNLCTYGGSASGAESITQCSNHNDDWCCNADAQHVDCCQESPVARPFFALEDGQSYATIGGNLASRAPVLSSITGIALSTGSDSIPKASRTTSSGESSTSHRSNLISATPAQKNSGFTTVIYGSTGVETVIVVSLLTPSSETTSSSSTRIPYNGNPGTHKSGIIVGCAVGIPLGLILLGILVWMLRRQRQQTAHPYSKSTELHGSSTAAGEVKKKEKRHYSMRIAELEGHPFSFNRPQSSIKSPIELEAGTVFKSHPRVPHDPNDFSFGGRTGTNRSEWESLPPRYQPRVQQAADSYQVDGIAELSDTETIPPIVRNSKSQRNVTDWLSKTYGR